MLPGYGKRLFLEKSGSMHGPKLMTDEEELLLDKLFTETITAEEVARIIELAIRGRGSEVFQATIRIMFKAGIMRFETYDEVHEKQAPTLRKVEPEEFPELPEAMMR